MHFSCTPCFFVFSCCRFLVKGWWGWTWRSKTCLRSFLRGELPHESFHSRSKQKRSKRRTATSLAPVSWHQDPIETMINSQPGKDATLFVYSCACGRLSGHSPTEIFRVRLLWYSGFLCRRNAPVLAKNLVEKTTRTLWSDLKMNTNLWHCQIKLRLVLSKTAFVSLRSTKKKKQKQNITSTVVTCKPSENLNAQAEY